MQLPAGGDREKRRVDGVVGAHSRVVVLDRRAGAAKDDVGIVGDDRRVVGELQGRAGVDFVGPPGQRPTRQVGETARAEVDVAAVRRRELAAIGEVRGVDHEGAAIDIDRGGGKGAVGADGRRPAGLREGVTAGHVERGIIADGQRAGVARRARDGRRRHIARRTIHRESGAAVVDQRARAHRGRRRQGLVAGADLGGVAVGQRAADRHRAAALPAAVIDVEPAAVGKPDPGKRAEAGDVLQHESPAVGQGARRLVGEPGVVDDLERAAVAGERAGGELGPVKELEGAGIAGELGEGAVARRIRGVGDARRRAVDVVKGQRRAGGDAGDLPSGEFQQRVPAEVGRPCPGRRSRSVGDVERRLARRSRGRVTNDEDASGGAIDETGRRHCGRRRQIVGGVDADLDGAAVGQRAADGHRAAALPRV